MKKKCAHYGHLLRVIHEIDLTFETSNPRRTHNFNDFLNCRV